jgi:hypothetical protein
LSASVRDDRCCAIRPCPVDLHVPPVPSAPLVPPATWPCRQVARPFRDPEITAEDPAFTEDPGNPGCPKSPRKPDPPRKRDQRDWCAARDRAHPAAPDQAWPARLMIHGTRSSSALLGLEPIPALHAACALRSRHLRQSAPVALRRRSMLPAPPVPAVPARPGQPSGSTGSLAHPSGRNRLAGTSSRSGPGPRRGDRAGGEAGDTEETDVT